MNNLVTVTGMILEVSSVNDYDRRVVMLTKERGRITAFVRGARRQNNKMMAAANPFVFGNFKLFEGKSAYNLADAEILNYFEELRTDLDGMLLGSYFLEVAGYYTRENNDEILMLKLLFQSVRAIINENLDNRLVRSIFEIKALVINGEFPGAEPSMSETCKYAIQFIVNTKIEKLYTFTLNEEGICELCDFSTKTIKKYTDRPFKSLELLDEIRV